jgi:hypothetical protein
MSGDNFDFLPYKAHYDMLFQVISKSSRQRFSEAKRRGSISRFLTGKIAGRLLAAAVIACPAGDTRYGSRVFV